MDNGGLAAFIRSPTHRGGSNFFQHAQIITKKNLKDYFKYLLCKKNENLNRAFMHELFQHAFDIEVVWAYKWYLNWAKSLSAARCEIAEEQIWDMAILAIDIFFYEI